MNTNRRNIGIFLIILGILLIALIIYFGFFRNNRHQTSLTSTTINTKVVSHKLPSNLPRSGTNSVSAVVNHRTYNISSEAPHQINANDLGKIAMAFSGRLGSFSNQSGYTNISDLKVLMTKSMQDWSSTYIARLTKEYQNQGAFYGIKTHALLFSVDSFSPKKGQAEIMVTTQRQVTGSAQPYQQKIKINFLKVNGRWLVDGAYWIR